MRPFEDAKLLKLKFALLFHDPPWKPWGIGVGPYSLSGIRRGEEYWQAMRREAVRALRDVSESVKAGGFKALVSLYLKAQGSKALRGLEDALAVEDVEDERVSQLAAEALDYARRYFDSDKFEEYLVKCGSSRGSHEVQGVLLLKLLAAVLKGLAEKLKGQKSQAVNYVAELVDEAAEHFCFDGKFYETVKEADSLASAFDRMALYHVERSLKGGKHVEAMEAVFVNPFNPDLKIKLTGKTSGEKASLNVSTIGSFVAFYAAMLATAIAAYVAGSSREENIQADKLALLTYNLAYSLLEPTWYLVAGSLEGPRLLFPPPADTRVPTHSIFDHISAALMTANLLGNESEPELSGCMVLIDLASVQSWISESRRLRDLWASSWLASWLAWSTIRPLVERLGPDIMVQPPARLHPFYASWLLSTICGPDTNKWSTFCRFMSKLLGLPHYWPLDPTVPTTALIALPSKACGAIKDEILNNYQQAWSKLLQALINGGEAGKEGSHTTTFKGLDELYREVRNCLSRVKECGNAEERFEHIKIIAENWDNIKEILQRLEPPLPIRVNITHVNDAWSHALTLAWQICQNEQAERIEPKHACNKAAEFGINITVEDTAKLLLFQVLVDPRIQAKSAVTLRASGRRSGAGYLKLARRLHGLGAFSNCHMCGYGSIIVDGKVLRCIFDNCRLRGAETEAIRRYVSGLGDEKLCPYCLLKRMLRELLYSDASIVGLKMPDEVYDRIGRMSTNMITSRTQLAYKQLLNHVNEIVDKLLEHREELALQILAEPVGPMHFLKGEDRSGVARKLSKMEGLIDPLETVKTIESLILEAAHDASYPERVRGKLLAEELKKVVEDKRIWRYRRHFAIIAADGDKMGSGVLAGILGLSPRDYVSRVINVNESELPKRIIEEFYEWLVESYESAVSKVFGGRKVERTIIVTPSYRYTVSRALAAESLIERELVEALKGILIYSGGDDLLAMLPPVLVVGGQDGRIVYAALLLADLARHSYWGLRPDARTASVLSQVMGERSWVIELLGSPAGGFNRVPAGDVVVPALAAYGRSTVVYYTDVKTPLWMSLRTAHDLLESKDGTRLIRKCGSDTGLVAEKDILVVGNESTLVAALPFEKDRKELSNVIYVIMRLLEAVEGEELSSSILYDVEQYAYEYGFMIESCSLDSARLLVKRLLSRNIKGGHRRAEESTVEQLMGVLSSAYDEFSKGFILEIRGRRKISIGSKEIWRPQNLLAMLAAYAKEYAEEEAANRTVLHIYPLLSILQAVKSTKMAY